MIAGDIGWQDIMRSARLPATMLKEGSGSKGIIDIGNINIKLKRS